MSAPHLSDEQVAELAEILDRDLRVLERSMRVTDEAMRPVELDQTAVGRLSRIDSLQNQGLTRNLQEREQAKLGLLVAALRRMEAGTFGVCTECQGPIAFGRLLVMPEAATCGGCAP